MSEWVMPLQKDLVVEFDPLRKGGLKFNGSILRTLAMKLVSDEHSEWYSNHMLDPKLQKPIVTMIISRWVQTFMQRHQIVSCKQTGKVMVSGENNH